MSVSETMRSGSRLPQHPCLWHVQNVPFLFHYCSRQASLSLNLGIMAASSSFRCFSHLFIFFRTVDANFVTVNDSPAESVSVVLKVAQPAPHCFLQPHSAATSLLTHEICPRITKVSINLNPDLTHNSCLLWSWAQTCLWASRCHCPPLLLFPAWCTERCVQVPGASLRCPRWV